MKIEFDPSNETDVEMIRRMLGHVTATVDVNFTPKETTVDERAEVPVTPDAPAAAPTLPDIPAPPATAAEEAAGMPEDDEPDPAAEPAAEVDKHGRPWDERIDSGNRKMTTSGEWQKRRNVDDVTRAAVLEELALAAVTPEAVFTPPAPPATAEVPEAPSGDTPVPAAPTALEWGDVFQRTMNAVQGQMVTQQQMDAKVKEYGIDGGFPGLIAHPDKWGLFLMELQID